MGDFTCSSVSIPLDELDEEDEVVIFDYVGDEGDYAFMTEDSEWAEPDYGIDFNFFPSDEQMIYKGLTEENGLSMISKTYGAGRDG